MGRRNNEFKKLKKQLEDERRKSKLAENEKQELKKELEYKDISEFDIQGKIQEQANKFIKNKGYSHKKEKIVYLIVAIVLMFAFAFGEFIVESVVESSVSVFIETEDEKRIKELELQIREKELEIQNLKSEIEDTRKEYEERLKLRDLVVGNLNENIELLNNTIKDLQDEVKRLRSKESEGQNN